MPSFDAPAEWFEDKLVFDEEAGVHFPVPIEDGVGFAFHDALGEAFWDVLNEGLEVEDEYDDEGSQLESDQEIYESPNTSSFEISDSEVSSDSSDSSDNWSVTKCFGTLSFSSSETAEDQVNLADLSDPTLLSSPSSPETNNGVFEDMTNIEADPESIDSEEMSIEDAETMLEDMCRVQDELEDRLDAMGKKLDELREDIDKNIADCDKFKSST